MLCGLAPLDIIAVRWAMGLPGPTLARPAEARCILAACILAAFDLAVMALLVSALFVSAAGVSALAVSGLATAGRSTYLGASAACGASALFDASIAFAGAGALLVSTPPSERLRSPACAAAEARTNPAMKMNLRIFLSPREVDGEIMRGGSGLM
jgi:hypothetical protein